MHPDIADKRTDLEGLCRRFGAVRLEVFGSAARSADFQPATSDADFLVTFAPEVRHDLANYMDFKDAIEDVLGRSVDLVDRESIETSRNYIRRRRILAEAEAVCG